MSTAIMGGQDGGEKVQVPWFVAPYDPRFPNTNQTRFVLNCCLCYLLIVYVIEQKLLPELS